MNFKIIAGFGMVMATVPLIADEPMKVDSSSNPADASAVVAKDPIDNALKLGLRGGFPLKGDDYFGDVFTEWTPTGWGFALSDDFSLRFGVTGGVGVLGDGSRTAVLFHVGPYIEVIHRPSGFSILGRSEPLVMSRHRFGFQNLGSDFQFVSSMGLVWRHEDTGWGVGVAYQHISNAGMANANPGTDHVIFSASYRF